MLLAMSSKQVNIKVTFPTWQICCQRDELSIGSEICQVSKGAGRLHIKRVS